MDCHAENLQRVRVKLSHAILMFVTKRRMDGRLDFHADDLREYVNRHAPGALGSPDRVLRDLRQRGLVNYELLSRRGSLYRIVEEARHDVR